MDAKQKLVDCIIKHIYYADLIKLRAEHIKQGSWLENRIKILRDAFEKAKDKADIFCSDELLRLKDIYGVGDITIDFDENDIEAELDRIVGNTKFGKISLLLKSFLETNINVCIAELSTLEVCNMDIQDEDSLEMFNSSVESMRLIFQEILDDINNADILEEE